MNRSKLKQISLCAIFTSIIAATAWISIPTGFGVNLTFQLFGVCLTAFILGVKSALAATAVYIVLGAAGLPVFSYFTGGFGVLVGITGGFLWGFLFSAILCGVSKNIKHKATKYGLMTLAVLLCHAAGVTQFCIITGNGVWAAFLTVSLPFLLKDLILVFLAEIVSKKIKIL